MNPVRLVQATLCLGGSLLMLWINQGLVAALFALSACGLVALARGEARG